MKNSSILTLFITTCALSLSSISRGQFDVSTLFSRNLLLITSKPEVSAWKYVDPASLKVPFSCGISGYGCLATY